MTDGYLVGYLDANDNFVEVGRFNNASANTTDPVHLRHANSGETVELDGSGFSGANLAATSSFAVPIYSTDGAAPAESLFFNDAETTLKYKDASGTVHDAGGGGHSVSDDGAEVAAEPTDVNFGTNLTVTDDGDGTVTVDANGGGSGGLSDYEWTFYVHNDSGTFTVVDSSGGVATTSSSFSTALQYTVDNTPAGGGTTLLTRDTFSISSGVSISTSGYTLRMVDGGTINASGDHTTFDIAADDVTVDNITYSGSGTSSTDPIFLGASTADTEYTDLTVTGCNVSNCKSGIRMRAFSDINIDSNYVTDVGNYGILLLPNGTASASGGSVSENHLDTCGFNGIGLYGDSTHVSVNDNVVTATGHSAIACSPAQHVTVTGNVVRDVTNADEAGIEVEFKSGHGGSTPSQDVTVDGNIVDNCTWGVFVGDRENAGNTPINITVTDNVVTACGTGLNVGDGEDLTLGGNSLRNNTTDADLAGGTNVQYQAQSGQATKRTLWVVNSGAADPAASDANDLIFERE